MDQLASAARLIRFGVFELDLRTGELRKSGVKLRLHGQPVEVLKMLLERPGELVTREELEKRLWVGDTVVEFEHGINAAVNRLREALGDSADNPRFVETLSRRGYRFIYPVESHHPLTPSSERRGADSPPGSGGGPGVVAVGAIQEIRPPDTVAPVAPVSAPGVSVAAVSPPPTETAVPEKFGAGADRRYSRLRVALAGASLVAIVAALLALNVAGLRDRALRAVGAIHESPLQIRSIAVLPLENLSGDKEQEYFADGMTEELITDLGKISALRVISRTSVTQYKATQKPLPEIARELNVDAVVEGSVLRSGDRVRITAQLIQANPERHLWAESYERDLHDVLALQGEVAQAIASEIKIKVTPQEHVHLAATRPINPEAHDLYLKGRYEWNKRTEQGLKKGMQYFEDAIAKDPNYAAAYAGLADSYQVLGSNGIPSAADIYPKARAAALKALEIDGDLADAHASLAVLLADYDHDWTGAEREYRRAIELNPGYATAHHWYALLLSVLGRRGEALREIEEARKLDPLSAIINANVGLVLYFARRYDAAIEQLQKALELEPNDETSHTYLGWVYLQKGMHQQAIAEFQKAANQETGSLGPLAGLAQAYAIAGKREDAHRVLNQLKALSGQTHVVAYPIADIYVGLGEREEAFAWLERAFEAHGPYLNALNVDPSLDSLRSDPRFQDLLRRMNFPK